MKNFKLPKTNCYLVMGAKRKQSGRYTPYDYAHVCGAFKTRRAALQYIKKDGKDFYPKTPKWKNYFFVILNGNITNTYRNNMGFSLNSFWNKDSL